MTYFFQQPLATWPTLRGPWILLAISATALVATALYFQYVQGLVPCVQCIYQRTAMIAVALFAWLAVIAPQKPFIRATAWLGWMGSSIAGFYSAHHHIYLQTRANPFFSSCSPFPDFPSFAPLHEWFPSIFAAGGVCTEIDWSFFGLSMPAWMRVIFGTYILIALTVFTVRAVQVRRV